MLEINKVKRGSPFARAGVKKGEYIMEFDGHPYVDRLDVLYYASLSSFEVTVCNKKGNTRKVFIQKSEEEELGISYPFQDFDIKVCKNRCMFCFVEQCPKNMRASLYVKDDDYRLSFICGSFVTLSNITEDDIERIIRLKLSPLYISVHCFDPEIKKKLCGNPKSALLFDILKRLAAAGIKFHTQIVMVEGVNSGMVLQQTVNELYKLHPYVLSCAIVPVGLTKYREKLSQISTVSPSCASATIDFAEEFAQMAYTQGTRFVWCSDEMYIIAGRAIPDFDYYESFSQIENGVGEVSTFFQQANEELSVCGPLHGNYVCVTGEAFAPMLSAFAQELCGKYDVNLEVRTIVNDYFGHTVTVAGLITATDIIDQLKDSVQGRKLIIPSTMLKEFEDVFLDGISVKELCHRLHCEVNISEGGASFIKILEGIK